MFHISACDLDWATGLQLGMKLSCGDTNSGASVEAGEEDVVRRQVESVGQAGAYPYARLDRVCMIECALTSRSVS